MKRRPFGARTAAVVCVILATAGAPPTTPFASADPNESALNGTFAAKSDGQWAKTNDRYHDEATVQSTWTIVTSCTATDTCSGHVTSDAGWSADVSYIEPMWYVSRTIDGWMPCPDGSAVSARQTFKFFADQFDKPKLRGWDNTIGPSGACGVNKVLNIEMPFTLLPLG